VKLDASLGIPRAATCGTPAVPPAPPRLFARAKRWGDMPGLFTDEMLGAFAVQADPGGVGDALKER
jgi:hypothetical protein